MKGGHRVSVAKAMLYKGNGHVYQNIMAMNKGGVEKGRNLRTTRRRRLGRKESRTMDEEETQNVGGDGENEAGVVGNEARIQRKEGRNKRLENELKGDGTDKEDKRRPRRWRRAEA